MARSCALPCLLGAIAAAVLTGCDDPPGTDFAFVDGAGGRLAVRDGPLDGASLTIPPGALTDGHSFGIQQYMVSPLPANVVVIGPMARFGVLGSPELRGGVEFLTPATATLPIDPALVPGFAADDDIVAMVWNGVPSDPGFVPVRVAGGRRTLASFPLRRTATAVLCVRTRDAHPSRSTRLPLLFGSMFRFDDGSIWEIRDATGGADLPAGPVALLDTGDFGAWITFDAIAGFALAGVRAAAVDSRWMLDGQLGLLFAQPSAGLRWSSARYRRFDGAATTPAEVGEVVLTIAESPVDSLPTPLGTFTGVSLLEVGPPAQPAWGRLWLAPGVGVIAFEIPPLGRAGLLVEGIVGGEAIVPR